jgi:conjugative transfer signal peptidase TraF
MTRTLGGTELVSRQRRIGILLIVSAACIAIGIIAMGWVGGLRINMTASEPLGLWRVVTISRPVAVGDVVFVCPPDIAVMREARTRGYVRSGICKGGLAPLIKTVIAVEGQRVVITDHVAVDGVTVANSRPEERDGRGRNLDRASGGIVPAGNIFLHSAFVGSWDSRYFGPVPAAGVIGLAREVLTYAP